MKVELEWIEVEARQPEYDERVLIARNIAPMFVPMFGKRDRTDRKGEHWKTDAGSDLSHAPTHWAAAPEMPK